MAGLIDVGWIVARFRGLLCHDVTRNWNRDCDETKRNEREKNRNGIEIGIGNGTERNCLWMERKGDEIERDMMDGNRQ